MTMSVLAVLDASEGQTKCQLCGEPFVNGDDIALAVSTRVYTNDGSWNEEFQCETDDMLVDMDFFDYRAYHVRCYNAPTMHIDQVPGGVETPLSLKSK